MSLMSPYAAVKACHRTARKFQQGPIRTSRAVYSYLFRASGNLGVLSELVKLFSDSSRDGMNLSTSRLSGSGESLR